MPRLPEDFRNEYENYGETFFHLAELLYANHGHQFTTGDLAEEVDVSKPRVSDFTGQLSDDGWFTRHQGQTTFVWNTEAHNPATTEMTDAVFGLYADLWEVFKRHTNTTTGMFATMGFVFLVATGVLWALYVGFRLGIANESVIPITGYVVLGLALGFSGIVTTAMAPLFAVLNRLRNRFRRVRHTRNGD
jgi:DNA-binding MarR family transcriptional regulator